MSEEVKSEEKRVLDIFPLGIGKRLLIFLCDTLIVFLLSFLLFNVAAYPIAKAVTGYDNDSDKLVSLYHQRSDLLYEKELLFYEESSKYVFNDNIITTFDYYLAYYVENAFIPKEVNHEVFNNYYVKIRGDSPKYFKVYEGSSYFDISNNVITMKSEYVDEFKDYFDPQAELGDKAKQDLETFQNKFFLAKYNEIYSDIDVKDLCSSTSCYNSLTKQINEITSKRDLCVLICTYISFLLGAAIVFLIYPLINKNRKTPSMWMLRVERVSSINIRIISRSTVVLTFFYNLAMSLFVTFFVPLPTVTFESLFNLGVLFPLAVISLGVALISLIFTLFSSFNSTLTDFFTKTTYITEEDLDEIYTHKGTKF